MPTTVTSEQFIKASPKQVYFAFTRAVALTEWLCDFATVAPRPGGRMYLWWHGDFYSAGEYVELEENKSIKFKWFARSEPAASEVLVTLKEQKGGTLVTLAHTIPAGDTVPDSEEWKKRADGFKAEWDSALPNLAQVLETGLDKRAFDRPMLGINISDFNAEIAKTMGVPVSDGIRLDETRAGMGAHAAGLRKDDVLVELNGHKVTNDFGTFVLALQDKKGGDKVPVVFYRGAEKKTVTMELTKRPVPDVPWEPVELAKRMRLKYDESLAALEKAFAGVSEAEADREPAAGEWSAKQTLAHLIHTERGWIANLDDTAGGYPRLADDWGGNIPAHINATVKAYGTVEGMLAELRRLSVEMVAFLAALPASFVERKAGYFLAAAQTLELESHTLSHTDQINAALAAAKKK
jgi:uncharacterized protein YndB with AHSA1/START domain